MNENKAIYEPVDPLLSQQLEDMCQQNGWLKRGGYDWQDDPYLEEYPYSFARVETIDDLRECVGGGNWSIRTGFVYDDLAFIQQVNGGDEWWTLKKTDDGWLSFESWSFSRIAQDPIEFDRAITSMHIATPEQCKRLEYGLSDSEIQTSLKERADGATRAADLLEKHPSNIQRDERTVNDDTRG
jgi:hypothetical protein